MRWRSEWAQGKGLARTGGYRSLRQAVLANQNGAAVELRLMGSIDDGTGLFGRLKQHLGEENTDVNSKVRQS